MRGAFGIHEGWPHHLSWQVAYSKGAEFILGHPQRIFEAEHDKIDRR